MRVCDDCGKEENIGQELKKWMLLPEEYKEKEEFIFDVCSDCFEKRHNSFIDRPMALEPREVLKKYMTLDLLT